MISLELGLKRKFKLGNPFGLGLGNPFCFRGKFLFCLIKILGNK